MRVDVMSRLRHQKGLRTRTWRIGIQRFQSSCRHVAWKIAVAETEREVENADKDGDGAFVAGSSAREETTKREELAEGVSTTGLELRVKDCDNKLTT